MPLCKVWSTNLEHMLFKIIISDMFMSGNCIYWRCFFYHGLCTVFKSSQIHFWWLFEHSYMSTVDILTPFLEYLFIFSELLCKIVIFEIINSFLLQNMAIHSPYIFFLGNKYSNGNPCCGRYYIKRYATPWCSVITCHAVINPDITKKWKG
jgi:hypothetical protein